jgi:hypothetical protein
MKLIDIIKNNLHYEVLSKSSIQFDSNEIIRLNYNNNLDPIISQIKKYNIQSKKLIKILELIKKYKTELNFDNAAYICFYNKSLNVLKLENYNIIYKNNIIIIINMNSLIYDLENYEMINKNFDNIKLFCILTFTGISLIIINKLFF